MPVISYTKEKQKEEKKKKFRTLACMLAGIILLLNLGCSVVNNLHVIKKLEDELAVIKQQIQVQEVKKETLEQESKDPSVALERKAREMGYGSINDQIFITVD